ncbi:MAG: hypothetical protein KGL39_16695 [Patescibacteria group bacterium]|nr:hypothetical protein [Patescibacteria group bacterium]
MDMFSLGGALLGGLFGGSGGQAKQTQSNAPWEGAQPWISQNIQNAQDLQNFYQRNPFSQGQQQAYGNQQALTDSFRANLPGLFGSMNTQRQFDRTNPLARPTQFQFQAPSYSSGANLGFSNPWDAILTARALAAQEAANKPKNLMDNNYNTWSSFGGPSGVSGSSGYGDLSLGDIATAMGMGGAGMDAAISAAVSGNDGSSGAVW